MKQNSISFKIPEEKFNQLVDVVRCHQGEEIFLFVETDENNNAIVLGVDNVEGNDVVVFTKE